MGLQPLRLPLWNDALKVQTHIHFLPPWVKGNHIPTFYEVVFWELKNICAKRNPKKGSAKSDQLYGPLATIKKTRKLLLLLLLDKLIRVVAW